MMGEGVSRRQQLLGRLEVARHRAREHEQPPGRLTCSCARPRTTPRGRRAGPAARRTSCRRPRHTPSSLCRPSSPSCCRGAEVLVVVAAAARGGGRTSRADSRLLAAHNRRGELAQPGVALLCYANSPAAASAGSSRRLTRRSGCRQRLQCRSPQSGSGIGVPAGVGRPAHRYVNPAPENAPDPLPRTESAGLLEPDAARPPCTLRGRNRPIVHEYAGLVDVTKHGHRSCASRC